MGRAKKVMLVLGGYAFAFVVSILAAYVYGLSFSAEANNTMGGMIAGGQMMLGFAVFCLLSLVPTGLALWFLRESRTFWSAFSIAGLAFAIAGVAAVFAPLAAGAAMNRSPWLGLVSVFGIMQMFGAPLWVGSFLLFAALAPADGLRRRLLVAAGIEVLLGVCGLVHFFLPGSGI